MAICALVERFQWNLQARGRPLREPHITHLRILTRSPLQVHMERRNYSLLLVIRLNAEAFPNSSVLAKRSAKMQNIPERIYSNGNEGGFSRGQESIVSTSTFFFCEAFAESHFSEHSSWSLACNLPVGASVSLRES